MEAVSECPRCGTAVLYEEARTCTSCDERFCPHCYSVHVKERHNVYVLGFLFSLDGQFVTLIRKKRPAWQRGKLNGIGGLVEPGETPADAIRREFREEAGQDISTWRERATIDRPGTRIHVFSAFAAPDDLPLTARGDEEIVLSLTYALPSRALTNLHWLVPMCADPNVRTATVIQENHTR